MDPVVALNEATEILERTPVVVRALLADLPEAWSRFRVEEGTWTPYDVLGHLIHGERTDWLPRIRVILEHGSSQAFTPFDREAMLGTEDDLGGLLDTFASLRRINLDDLAALGLDDDDCLRLGMHPDLGEVTLSALVAAWAVHDLSHVAQMTETMAKRYRDHVGPWRAYLPVVDRAELTD
jgi:hypothetical protein